MDADQSGNIYGPDQIRQIEEMTTLLHPPLTGVEILSRPDLLEKADIIFSGWGMCQADRSFLDTAAHLKALFYGAGSVRGFMTDDLMASGIPVTTAYAANAVPVAEFTFAQIIMALKKGFYFARSGFGTGAWEREKADRENIPGCYGSTVGLVSLGMIGSRVLNLLSHLDVRIKVYDINRDEALAVEKGFTYCSLEEVFESCDVVSLHTAYLPATKGMITPSLLQSMKQGASLINTARGGLIDEPGMISVLRERSDLSAYLDVLSPEPPSRDNPLLSMSNVFITPHIAGSLQTECRRMGQIAVEECRRFLSGEPLMWQVTEKMLETMA